MDTIAIVLAAVGFIASFLRINHQVKLTSELNRKVDMLSVHLEKSIFRLDRVRDLVTGLMKTSVMLRQMSRSEEEKRNCAVEREMAIPELQALIAVIDDDILKKCYEQLHPIIADKIWELTWNPESWEKELIHRQTMENKQKEIISRQILQQLDKLLAQQSKYTTDIHRRLLELLKDVIQDAEV